MTLTAFWNWTTFLGVLIVMNVLEQSNWSKTKLTEQNQKTNRNTRTKNNSNKIRQTVELEMITSEGWVLIQTDKGQLQDIDLADLQWEFEKWNGKH